MSDELRPEPDAGASRVIEPAGWPRPRGYAHGILSAGVLAVSGQIGWDPETLAPAGGGIATQTRQALANVLAVVHAAGMTAADVARLTWYVTDRDEYLTARATIGSAYRALFGGHFPAMSVVIVAGLVEVWAKVEIEATAIRRSPG